MTIREGKEYIKFSNDIKCTYQVRSERDKRNVVALKQLLASEQHPFDRSKSHDHVTATGFIVDDERHHTLLLHHRALDIWLPPGGHCDGDADVLSGALREAQEETGLQTLTLLSTAIFDIDIHKIPANRRDPEHYHYDVRFLLQADRHERLQGNEESKALRWVALTELQTFNAMPSILVLRQKLVTP